MEPQDLNGIGFPGALSPIRTRWKRTKAKPLHSSSTYVSSLGRHRNQRRMQKKTEKRTDCEGCNVPVRGKNKEDKEEVAVFGTTEAKEMRFLGR